MVKEPGGGRVELTAPDGKRVVASVGNVGLTVDDTIVSMSRRAERKDGIVYLPICWFANNIFSRFITSCNGSLYISDHYGQMTKDMSVTIREILP